MCLAVPGKIVKIDGNTVIVDYGVEQRNGTILEDDYVVGDYVIIQGGIVAVKIPEKEAVESLKMYVQALS